MSRRGGRFFAALILAALACSMSLAAPLEWYYQPVGKDVRADIASTATGQKAAPWRPVALPHVFDREQREDNVNGWYVADVNIPSPLQGMPLILDLGLMDDADETFLNGTLVGKTGNPEATEPRKGSAWREDRLYIVPVETVRDGANLLAVRVKDFTGVGGFLGQPYVGALLCPDCRYQEGASKWQGRAFPLRPVPGMKEKYASYQFQFDAPAGMGERDIPVDLGRVYDAAEVSLNGKFIARIGAFPPEQFRQTAARLKLILPREHLKAKENVLAVRVFNDGGAAMLIGVPSIPVTDLDFFPEPFSTRNAFKERGMGAFRRLSQGRRLDLCDYLVHSGFSSEVASLCETIVNKPDSPGIKHRAQCMEVYALWLAGRPDAAWECFQDVDLSHHIPYSTATAMSDYCLTRSDPGSGILYRHKDLATQGDWQFAYGIEHAVLCAMGSPFDISSGLGPKLGWEVSVNSPDEKTRAWVGASDTEDARALYFPAGDTRRYASWDDRGEIQPFDEKGPDLVLDMDVPEGAHLLSLYFVDWDWHDTPHPRVESIIVSDAEDRVLSVVSTGRFGDGHYERFLIQGPHLLRLRITKQRSPCAILSGVFLDAVPPLQPLPITTPLTPQRGKSVYATGSVANLRTRYKNMKERSEESVLALVCSEEFAQFEADVLSMAQERSVSEVLWWAFECKRLRFNVERTGKVLDRYLDAVRLELGPNEKNAAFRALARNFTRLRLCPGYILRTMQYAARESGGAEEKAEYDLLLRSAGLGYLNQAAGIWREHHPLNDASVLEREERQD